MLTPVGMGAFFGLLSLEFDYPAVMDDPPAEVLRAVFEAEGRIEIWWLGVTLAACLLLLVSVGLPMVIASERDRAVGTMVAASGATAALMTILDTGQWVWLYPDMADRWSEAGEPLRLAIEADWSSYHELVGEGIGRYLATLFSALWALGLGVLLLRSSRWPGLYGWAGIAAGALFLISALPGLSFDAWGLINTAGFGIWFVWLIVIGLALLGARLPRPLKPL